MSYPIYMVPSGDVLPILFASYAGATGASITLTGLAVTDIEIYKDGGTTQRASDAGYTLLDTDGIDFDGITGIHGFSIDTGDNTDANFYTVGAWFHVVVSAVTIDSQTVNFIAAAFRLLPAESQAGAPKVDVAHFGGTAGTFSGGRPEVNTSHAAGTAWNSGAIGPNTLAADTITAAKVATDVSAEIADAVWDEDATGHQTQGSFGQAIGDPVADTDTIWGLANTNLNATVSSRASQASVDAVKSDTVEILTDTSDIQPKIGTPASVTVSADIAAVKAETASIQADTNDLQTRLPAALIGGRMDSNAQAAATDLITNTVFAASAAQEIADETLNRDIAGGASGGARNVRSALRRLRNRVGIAAGTLTTYQENDTSAAWTAAVTTTAGNPVSDVDPA